MRSLLVRRFAVVGLAAAALLPGVANAALVFTNTWNGSEGDLAAQAVIRYYDDGTLTITLSNTSGVLSNEPSELLTGVYWDYSGATLTAVSAFGQYNGNSDSSIIAQVDKVEAWPTAAISGGTNDGSAAGYDGNLGMEFGHREDSMSGFLDAGTRNYGVSSSGLGLFGPDDRYITGETDLVLSNPSSPDGLDLGLVSTNFVDGAGNGGMDSQPLLRGEVVFTYAVSGGTLESGDISDVFFQYGTNLIEPGFGGECVGCDPPTGIVPVPPAAGLAGLGLLMVAGRKAKKRMS